jgi:hypothetical protein
VRSTGVVPRISVLMPSLNQNEFIEAAIRSVLERKGVELELLVCDGGSSDAQEIGRCYALPSVGLVSGRLPKPARRRVCRHR